MEVGTIVVPQYHRKNKEWVVEQVRGRVFEVDGRRLEIFPIRVMARAIKRSPITVKTWERKGYFPAPMFVPPLGPKAPSRWYSKTQIANLRALYRKHPRLNKTAAFLREVGKVFYQLELTEDALKGDVL